MDKVISVRTLLHDAGLRPKKSWGQNFLEDANALCAIADAVFSSSPSLIIELGAGLGSLTQYLVNRDARVIAVERDRELIPHLQRVIQDEAEILEADAATLDYSTFTDEKNPLTVVGNLPYQISSRLLVSLAEAAPWVQRVVVMVQKEVGDRICSQPGRESGLLSILIQRAFTARQIRTVSPGCFFPKPNVTSVVIELTRKETILDRTLDVQLVQTARWCFASRRKTLLNSLSKASGKPKEEVLSALAIAKIEPSVRAETLSVEQFIAIAQACEQEGFFHGT